MVEPVVREGLSCWAQMGIQIGTLYREHVYPMDDYRPHELDGDGRCWCKPVFDAHNPVIVVHNAMDGREAFETGARRVS